MRHAVLALGTKNEHKGIALHTALLRLAEGRTTSDLVTEVLPCDVSSGVAEQPMGFSAMSLGAITRAERALLHVTNTHGFSGRYLLGLGIESGLECIAGRWIDVAVVAVVRQCLHSNVGSLAGLSTSVGIPFPPEFVAMALQDGLSEHTAGEKVAAVLGGDKTDPHSTLTLGRLSRASLLVDAIYAALVQVPGL